MMYTPEQICAAEWPEGTRFATVPEGIGEGFPNLIEAVKYHERYNRALRAEVRDLMSENARLQTELGLKQWGA